MDNVIAVLILALILGGGKSGKNSLGLEFYPDGNGNSDDGADPRRNIMRHDTRSYYCGNTHYNYGNSKSGAAFEGGGYRDYGSEYDTAGESRIFKENVTDAYLKAPFYTQDKIAFCGTSFVFK